MFKNQPSGLYVLSLANMGERFGYYTMLAIFLLFLQAKFGFDSTVSGQIYATFLAFVYFTPLVGGYLADKWSFSKCVVTGIIVMFLGYLVMSIPTPIRSNASLGILIAALVLIAIGTGLFKGNLQVMVGDLYNDPRYSSQRDSAFSIFYMAINIGSMFAPMTATAMLNFAMNQAGLSYHADLAALCNGYLDDPAGFASVAELTRLAADHGMTAGQTLAEYAQQYISVLSSGYAYGFGVACFSLVISFAIYAFGRKTFAHVVEAAKQAKLAKKNGMPNVAMQDNLTPEQTKSRVVALMLVFAVVIFFWMVFHQNGATLTEFAKSYTSPEAWGVTRIGFNVWALLAIAIGVYVIFGFFQTKDAKTKGILSFLFILVAAVVAMFLINTPNPVTGIQPQQYQQFNPFYVVALTPVSLAFFGWLASRKKEPSAPRKIGYGMLMAGLAYLLLMLGSFQFGNALKGDCSPNWLISTYLLLTCAELLLSPMGISFVSKVAPPKYKGSMMGGWFAATAIGNYLVSIPMLLWQKIPTWTLWMILICICLVSAGFIFSIMKKLEAATSDEPAVQTAQDIETVEDDAI